jgi:hypothetical protein
MDSAGRYLFGAIFGLALMISSWIASSELVEHRDATTIGDSFYPASENVTLGGVLFFVGLATLIASIMTPILGLVGTVLLKAVRQPVQVQHGATPGQLAPN